MNKKEKKYFEKNLAKNINSKEEINDFLRKKYTKNFSLTNINDLNYLNIDTKFEFKYNYQRFDAFLKYYNFEESFYNIKNISAKTIFTNCGMSSIFAVLFTLSKLGNFSIKYEDDIYFETQRLIKQLNLNSKIGKKVIFLDTISDKFNFEYEQKNSIIIIDTTCYHSHKFKTLIENLINNNNFCILVRSHIKLDMLGLEYASLGSITFLIPKTINYVNFSLIKVVLNFMTDFGILHMQYLNLLAF